MRSTLIHSVALPARLLRRGLLLAVVVTLVGATGPMESLVHCAPPTSDKEAIELFNGRDLTGWRKEVGDWTAASAVSPAPDDPMKFVLKEGTGVLVNGAAGKTVNLISEPEFGDVEAHFEFCIPKGSNSGIYFMGRYEIQVLDSFGKKDLKYGDNGGIYRNDQGWEGKGPAVNASRAPGEWQSFDVIFRAPRFDAAGKKTANATFVKVTHNGRVIHENVEVNGPTTAAAFRDEKPRGPIMLQGDHGPVAYRNPRVKELKPSPR
jgi:Domain of Unknown Function (DUF1080)